MVLNDPDLKEIINNSIAVEITNKLFTVEQTNNGSCDGCYFQDFKSCPKKAVNICTSNGGNILKLREPNKV